MKEKQRNMKYFLLPFFILVLGFGTAEAQLKSPEAFLGYPLGTAFTPHDEVVAYFSYLDSSSKNLKLVNYGKSYEGRPLLVAIISSKENIANLEQIRKDNLSLSRGQELAKPNNQPAILWLSYNVHGNEASSTETALRMLYDLVDGQNKKITDWLKNTVVIIDPCLNPDGRERYINYFKDVSGDQPDPNPVAREHIEPWPGGRYNHYYFDLNRDWAWQSQVETQHRLKLYHEWMPEVHVDFHEQNYNEPYYFAPAAEPIHQDITAWQKDFQVTVGQNNAKYFDERGWQYFTKERFDLLYPSYGDTYPLYNGSIGMTYEQGGIGAGLAVITLEGDTLTLKDRIEHHYTTGMSTLEMVSKHAVQLVAEFKLYFQRSMVSPPGNFKTYVVKAQNIARIRRLAELLKKNGIEYAFGQDKSLRGYNYESRKTENFKIERNDLIVNLMQPKAVLANVLFEPQTMITDSNTYDITAWALPFAYGLKAYGIKEPLKGNFNNIEEKEEQVPELNRPYAWIFAWNSIEDAQVLIALQRMGVKVRIAEQGFTIGGRVFSSGSLLVYRTENEKQIKGLAAKLAAIQKRLNKTFYPAASGYVEKGKDLGSSVYPILKVPKVAVAAGAGISSPGVGEIWHFFDQELNYPVTMILPQNIPGLDINKINVLIMPSGTYSDSVLEKLEGWINSGGKVILFEEAVAAIAGKKPFNIKLKEFPKQDELKLAALRKYGQKHMDDLSETIPGAIFRVDIDQSHPLSAGLGSYYYALKTDDKIYEPLNKGWNIGLLKSDSYMAGIAGKSIIKKFASGMLFGVEPAGKGTIIYLGTDLVFRSFWESGKQMFANAVFLVN
ncbi:M14 metallopeptidase family protein [Pedobacter psychroterrae]|uniref:M14 metallopeptidase family protein n=1 Tax=Pedobacter psychroterrae TaxID=2530453 RepID=UPI001CED3011|nr:M14 metallopeptidase family protein [Pedobacter psychroterrae]